MKDILLHRMLDEDYEHSHDDHQKAVEALQKSKPVVAPIPKDLHMDEDMTADDQACSSSEEDVGADHIPTVKLNQSWWKPITEERPPTPEPEWTIPPS
nr:hypothetical protein [Tanacetum cinerariifolium]